ncbi:MAG: helix-turn-helix domain-containing protein [Candidatus Omnitrophica bacterium]|nr:helix-turn-helix domain-containing protein [Candidatus Omnitrophota bacterium]
MKRKTISKLMSVEELAQYLGLKRQTIYNWLHQRKISGIKIGKVWRFDREEILSWLREQKNKNNP